MRNALITTWTRFRHSDEGVTLVEYGIALILAIVVGGVALTNLGGSVSGQMDAASGLMTGTGAATSTATP